MKTAEKIKKISSLLLKESEVINKKERNIKNGYKLTNDYNDNVLPIGMLEESELESLKRYFKDKLNDYYYVEKI